MAVYIDLLRRNQNFRYLWVASVISWAGDWFNTIATIVLVNRYTHSGLAISALFLARTLPFFLVSPLAGVVVDRFNRKVLMVASDLLRFVIVLGFLWVDSAEEVWMIYVLLILQFIVSSFFQPASSAILPGLVNKDDLVNANVISSITWSAMLAAGSAIGGGFTSVFGVRMAIIIDAISFLFSALIIMRITLPDVLSQSGSSPSLKSETGGWADLIQGFSYLRQHRDVALLTLIKGLGILGSTDFLITIYAERIFPMGGEGAASLGILYGAAGVGSIIGPLLGQRITKGKQSAIQTAIFWGFVLVTIAWAILGCASHIFIAMLGFMIFEMGFSTNWTHSTVLIQFKVPDHFLGRIFALDLAFFTMIMSLTMWFSGFILDRFALAPTQLAFIFMVASLFPLLFYGLITLRKKRNEAGALEGE